MANDSWETPQKLFDKLNKEFNFTLDAAATGANVKGNLKWRANSLAEDWKGEVVFINPPYSRGNIEAFMEACYYNFLLYRTTIVAIVRLDPSTSWWQDFIHGTATQVRMFTKRIKFTGAADSYPFPTCAVVWSDNHMVVDEDNNTITEYVLYDPE